MPAVRILTMLSSLVILPFWTASVSAGLLLERPLAMKGPIKISVIEWLFPGTVFLFSADSVC